MELEFEWDAAKSARNLAKHGIDFATAILIFKGSVLERRSDREGEERWKALGALEGLELAVVYTVREGRHRIISARRAKRNERRAYRAIYPLERPEGEG